MIGTPSKRILEFDNNSSKRSRSEHVPRLCDLHNGAALFASKLNAMRAKEKGYLRSRDGSGKYEEVRRYASRAAPLQNPRSHATRPLHDAPPPNPQSSPCHLGRRRCH